MVGGGVINIYHPVSVPPVLCIWLQDPSVIKHTAAERHNGDRPVLVCLLPEVSGVGPVIYGKRISICTVSTFAPKIFLLVVIGAFACREFRRNGQHVVVAGFIPRPSLPLVQHARPCLNANISRRPIAVEKNERTLFFISSRWIACAFPRYRRQFLRWPNGQ